MQKLQTQHLTRAAAVGAAYAVLSLFSSVFSLTFGVVQCRFSEALCVLPFFFPETVWGLFAGCLITNLLSPYGLLDLIVGSLATLHRRPADGPMPEKVAGPSAAGGAEHSAGGGCHRL